MENEWFLNPDNISGLRYLELYEHRMGGDRTEREINSILRCVHADTHSAFLDIPCGQGRHSIALALRGYRVTGVDVHPDLIAEAEKKRLAYRLEHATFIQDDMRTWKREHTFDIALSLYVGFGYFADDTDDDAVLANICASLKTGGTFVVEYLHSAKILDEHREGPQKHEDVLSSGEIVTTKTTVSNDSKYYVITHETSRSAATFQLRLYTPEELEVKIQNAGFTTKNIFGDYDRSPLRGESPRVLMVAAK